MILLVSQTQYQEKSQETIKPVKLMKHRLPLGKNIHLCLFHWNKFSVLPSLPSNHKIYNQQVI